MNQFKNYGIILGMVVQIFIAGIAWGTLWTKVANLERLLYLYVAQGPQHSYGPTQGRSFGPPEASAAPKSIGERSNVSTTSRDSVIPN